MSSSRAFKRLSNGWRRHDVSHESTRGSHKLYWQVEYLPPTKLTDAHDEDLPFVLKVGTRYFVTPPEWRARDLDMGPFTTLGEACALAETLIGLKQFPEGW